MKTTFYSFTTLIRKILFSSLEYKIHILAPPCNIPSLYVISYLKADMEIIPQSVSHHALPRLLAMLQQARQEIYTPYMADVSYKNPELKTWNTNSYDDALF